MRRSSSTSWRRVVCVVATLGSVPIGTWGASAAPLPARDGRMHLGVSNCAGTVCHGSGQARTEGKVRQAEYSDWLQRDLHSKAFEALRSDRSKKIASILGVGAADQAPLCLDCHADNVEPALRGERFHIEDGVGCEACHGGAEEWIKSHAGGEATRAENLAKGMYPSDDLVARAGLCLSCHLGDDDKFVSHRLMAAGHPRTSFELDTFTQIQPAHFVPDDDYKARKQVASAAKVWAVGQAVGLREYLAALASPRRSRDGAWPEFVLYDCYSCHREIAGEEAAAGTSRGFPGLNETGFLFFGEILRRVDSRAQQNLQNELQRLSRAARAADPAAAAIARRAGDLVAAALTGIAAWEPSPGDVNALLHRVASSELAAHYQTFSSAEQAFMAVQALVATLQDSGQIDGARSEKLKVTLDALYEATERPEEFQPARFQRAVGGLRAALE